MDINLLHIITPNILFLLACACYMAFKLKEYEADLKRYQKHLLEMKLATIPQWKICPISEPENQSEIIIIDDKGFLMECFFNYKVGDSYWISKKDRDTTPFSVNIKRWIYKAELDRFIK